MEKGAELLARESTVVDYKRRITELEQMLGKKVKEEGHSRFLAAEDISQLQAIVAERVCYYNVSRRHSSLEYQTPVEAFRQLRLDYQGTDNASVDSVDNPDGVAHPDRRLTTATTDRRNDGQKQTEIEFLKVTQNYVFSV